MADETREKRPYTRRTSVESVEQSEIKEEKTFTKADVQRMVAEAVAKAMASVHQAQPQIIVKETKEEDVTLLYMGCVSDGAKVHLGGQLGDIQGRGGMLTVPKKLFLQNFNDNVLRRLKDRRLIVIDGLDENERERHGLNYTDGELVSQDIYYKLFSLEDDRVCDIFDKACYRHKQLIATLYYDEYVNGGNRITQPLAQRLNELSKKVEKEGMFKAMLKGMALDLQDEAESEQDE